MEFNGKMGKFGGYNSLLSFIMFLDYETIVALMTLV